MQCNNNVINHFDKTHLLHIMTNVSSLENVQIAWICTREKKSAQSQNNNNFLKMVRNINIDKLALQILFQRCL